MDSSLKVKDNGIYNKGFKKTKNKKKVLIIKAAKEKNDEWIRPLLEVVLVMTKYTDAVYTNRAGSTKGFFLLSEEHKVYIMILKDLKMVPPPLSKKLKKKGYSIIGIKYTDTNDIILDKIKQIG